MMAVPENEKTNELLLTAPPTRTRARRLTSKKRKPYSDEKLCEDIACGDFTTNQIAERNKVSISLVRQLTRGDVRPELKKRIDLLHEDFELESRRFFKSKVRHMAARLIKQTEKDGMAGVKATIESLHLGGIQAEEEGSQELRIIRLPFRPPGVPPPEKSED